MRRHRSGCNRGAPQLDSAVHLKPRQERFLAAFTISGNIVHACRAAGISRQSHYYWLQEDPTYAARFEQSRQVAAQMLEDLAVRLAVEGIRRPVTYQGRQVIANVNGVREPLFEIEYSDKLLVALLKANNPAKWSPPKETINLLELDPDLLTTDQLDKLLDHLLVKMVGNDPEAIEAARRDLAAGPAPMGTPTTRLREAEGRLQKLAGTIESLVSMGLDPNREDLLGALSEIKAVTAMFAAPATAAESPKP